MMRKLLRNVLASILKEGGSKIEIWEGGKHTRIAFTGPDGRRSNVLIQRGTAASPRLPTAIRSQIRRKLAK
jgi:hypothetical protein